MQWIKCCKLTFVISVYMNLTCIPSLHFHYNGKHSCQIKTVSSLNHIFWTNSDNFKASFLLTFLGSSRCLSASISSWHQGKRIWSEVPIFCVNCCLITFPLFSPCQQSAVIILKSLLYSKSPSLPPNIPYPLNLQGCHISVFTLSLCCTWAGDCS